jgi:hypothetical protein
MVGQKGMGQRWREARRLPCSAEIGVVGRMEEAMRGERNVGGG